MLGGLDLGLVRLRSLPGRAGSSLIGFLQAGIGAILRSMLAKGREWVDAADFGAVYDDTTNDAAAINLAITYATGVGKGVRISGPAYCGTTKIVQKSNVLLFGHGYKAALRWATGTATGIEGSGIANAHVYGLRLTGAGTANADISKIVSFTDASTDCSVRGCWIDTGYIGVFVGDVSSTSSSRIAVEDNVFYNIGLNAVGVNCFGTNNSVRRNLIRNYGIRASGAVIAAAIEYRGAQKGAIQDNIIQDGNYGGAAYNDGIRLEYATEGATQQVKQVVVTGNTIDTFSGYGINSIYAAQCTISHNNIKGSVYGYSIWLQSSSTVSKSSEDNTVEGNTVDGGVVGIRLESNNAAQPTRRNKVSNNQCLNQSSEGIGLFLADDNEVNDNRCYLATGAGIRQDSGNRNLIAINKCHNCGTGGTPGVEIVGGADTRLVDNETIDTRGPALMTYGLRIYAGPTDTIIEGGKYLPALTGGILDAGTRTSAKMDGGKQTIAYAATITPNALSGETIEVGTLTGNVLVALPLNPVEGMKQIYHFTQDGVGGRTVTWNANFDTNWVDTGNTASKRATVAFTYFASYWRQVGAQRTWA